MTREEQARQAIIDWRYDGSEPETFEVGFLEGVKWATEWEQRRYEIAREILPYCCQASKEILLAGGKLEMEGITFADKVATQAVMFADALINKLKN